MGNVARLNEALEAIEAERVIETVKLRSELIKACTQLLPTAISEASPAPACKQCGRAAQRGSATLLRLISRVAMRDVRLDRKKK